MVKSVFGLVVAVLVALTMAGIAGLGGHLAEEVVSAQAEARAEIDSLVDEFLAIQPRSKWPAVMSEITNGALTDEFVAGARDAGLELTENQYELVRRVIVPRLKERMACQLGRIDFSKLSELDVKILFKQQERQMLDWFERYKPAVAQMLVDVR